MRPVPAPKGHKWCPGCRAALPHESFNKDFRSRDGRDCYCRKCVSQKAKRYFKTYKEQRRKRKAALVLEFGNECANCKSKNIPIDAFVFHHHSERMTEETYLSPNRVLNQKQISVFEREREKWTMLCANCHCIHHGCGLTASQVMKLQ